MDQTTGDQKIQAIEAVLNEMINQRNAMQAMMMSNHSMMLTNCPRNNRRFTNMLSRYDAAEPVE